MTREQSARGQFGIGEVLAQLQPEFPDISTSKIRFLEAEGLIEPARSRSGYRRFSASDIERLRYILTMQRDSYLPLRVIRERLADEGEGSGAADGPAPAGRGAARRGAGRGGGGRPARGGAGARRPDPAPAARRGRDRRGRTDRAGGLRPDP